MRRWTRCVALLCGCAAMPGGCTTYTTPGGPADFRVLGISYEEQRDLTETPILQEIDRRPAASLPATIAVAHLQSPEYSSYTRTSYGSGRFSIVSGRDAETQQQVEGFAALPMVRGVAPLNRLVLGNRASSMDDLRRAAASVQADMLLLYTFDTRFGTMTTVPFAGVITLGLFPNEEARVRSTASAALIDTRTGYVYGLAEGTATAEQLANAWTTREAVDQSRLRAEADAFADLVAQLTGMWKQVVETYAPTATKR